MATLLKMVPPEKEDLSNKKIMKIGAFVQKLSMNKYLSFHIRICIDLCRRIA